MSKRLTVILIFLLQGLTPSAFTQTFNDSIAFELERALAFIKNTQFKTTKDYSFAGEWPATMGLDSWFPLLGGPKDYPDANCYTTASIHNCLATVYLLDKEKNAGLLSSLDLAYSAIQAYRDSITFNFWHKLSTNLPCKRKEYLPMLPMVRRPATYKLRTKYIRKAANVTDDADDTAAGFLAILLHDSVFNTSNNISLFPVVKKYRDKDRHNFHWQNWMHNDKKNTGAYLTWFGVENKLIPKSIITTVLHNLTFFLPFSECYPKKYTPYVPYGTNDVDPVVNANILHFLAKNNELKEENNFKGATDFIYRAIKRDRFNRVAIYYPNRYNLHYATCRAFDAGVIALESSVEMLVEHLKKEQKSNGSFESKRNVNRRDVIQSTAYALLAMLYAGNFEKYNTQNNIIMALRYLHKNKTVLAGEYYWKGGVFFSGGTVVKHCLFFKSDAYTTALIAEGMAIYLDIAMKKKFGQ